MGKESKDPIESKWPNLEWLDKSTSERIIIHRKFEDSKMVELFNVKPMLDSSDVLVGGTIVCKVCFYLREPQITLPCRHLVPCPHCRPCVNGCVRCGALIHCIQIIYRHQILDDWGTIEECTFQHCQTNLWSIKYLLEEVERIYSSFNRRYICWSNYLLIYFREKPCGYVCQEVRHKIQTRNQRRNRRRKDQMQNLRVLTSNFNTDTLRAHICMLALPA